MDMEDGLEAGIERPQDPGPGQRFQQDVAKVVDFGLVKALASETTDVTMSASIVLAGTPQYMPPEVLTATSSGDPRSDLYALGATGYFLLTSEPVFQAATVAEAFGHHLHSPPVPPSERSTQAVPPDLEAVILRCLAKNVDDRPVSARALLREGDAGGAESILRPAMGVLPGDREVVELLREALVVLGRAAEAERLSVKAA